MKLPRFSRLITVATLILCFATPLSAQEDGTGEAFGDWNAGCKDESDGSRMCAIWQVIATAADGPRLLHVEISFRRPYLEAEGAELLLILPLGISLREDPALHIDDKRAAGFKVDYCVNDGCYVRTRISAELLERMLRMSAATLKIKSGDGEPVSLPLSGTGSRAAFNSTE